MFPLRVRLAVGRDALVAEPGAHGGEQRRVLPHTTVGVSIRPGRSRPGPAPGRIVASPDEWLVALPGRLPAYLSVERYEANLARLAANRNTAATPGAVHNGTALLTGLLRCGRCGGHRVNVQYHAWGPAYVCSY
jgi:hypothetical protein